MGFGRPVPGSYESLMESLVGQQWQENAAVPYATFDLNFNGTESKVFVGQYNNSENLIFSKMASGQVRNWAIEAV